MNYLYNYFIFFFLSELAASAVRYLEHNQCIL